MQAAAAPRVSARNPAKKTQNVALDYDLKKDIEFYNKATEKLEGEPCDGSDLASFLKRFGAKAKQCNWMRILTFGQGNQTKNLIKHYGEITKAEVHTAALTYLGTNDRRDQDSDMVYNCLRKSITHKVFDQVATEPERYTFDIQGGVDPLEDGPSFLKAIIDCTYTNTLSNNAVARDNLSSLPEYMDSLPDSNIKEFNAHVKKQLEALAAGGETTNDLIINLWKGYAKAKDKDFRQWIKLKKAAWFDRTFIVNPNGLDLMELAENHYKDAVKTKDWLKLDEDQQTILALQTEIQAVKATARHGRHKNDGKTTKKGGKYKDKKKTESSEWAWKKVAPKSGETQVKTHAGETYHWCPHHELWSMHKPEDCLVKQELRKDKKDKKLSGKLKMRVYQAAMEEDSDEDGQEGGSNAGEDSSAEDSESS
jgi:hypothetical protein